MNIRYIIFQYLLISTTICNANQLDLEIAKKLIASKNLNINAQSENGSTLLHTVIHEDKPFELTEFLINLGADINLQDVDGNTPLHHLIIIEQLFNDEDEPELKNTYINLIKLYIQSGANLTLRNKLEETPLFTALIHESHIAAKLLLTIAQNIDVDAKDDGKIRALDIAAMDNSLEIAELLIKAGADINDCDNFDHMTPLHFAVLQNSFEVAQLLIKAGAHKNIKDIFGFTPYHYCQTKKMQSLF